MIWWGVCCYKQVTLTGFRRAIDKVGWNAAAEVGRRSISEEKLAPTHVGGYLVTSRGGFQALRARVKKVWPISLSRSLLTKARKMWVMAKRKRRTPDRGVKRPKGRAPARRQPGAVRPALCVVAVCLCLLLSLGDAWGKQGSRLEFSVVVPGLEYAHLRITNQPWSVHIARLERARPEFGIVSTLGQGVIQGLSPLSAQARSVPPGIGRPVAAVNGDFFLIHPGPYQGDPKGLQILNGELVSTPGQLSFWAAGHELHIDPVASDRKSVV